MYAPLSKKCIRGKNYPFMNRMLSKQITKRTRLKNKFLNSKSEDDKKNYSKQRNYCVFLLGRTKKKYYRNLEPEKVVDQRTFKKTVKPFLSKNSTENEKISLIEKEQILTNDSSVVKVFNTF